MKNKTMTGAEVKAIRQKLGLNQQQFWSPIGVTQSGGSRYETGRNIPKPVRLLIGIAYDEDPLALVIKIRGKEIGNGSQPQA